MHFLTLVPVTVPQQEPTPELDAQVREKIRELHASIAEENNFWAKIHAAQLMGKLNSFARAVNDAIDEKLDPYAEETDNPICQVFEDYTAEIQDSYRTGTVDCVRLADGLVIPVSDRRFYQHFEIKDGQIVQKKFGPLHHKKRSKKARKMTYLPDYPLKKLFRSEQALAEIYMGCQYDEESDAYGYYYNAGAFYDWQVIGGRWPHVFLVPEDCTEYSFGDYEGTEEETKGPEGYRWVAAARKKDIAWDAMANLSLANQADAYMRLKKAFEAKELPEKSMLRLSEDRILGIFRTMYVDGESLDTFRSRNGFPADSKYQFTPGGYLAADGYHDCNYPYNCPKDLKEAEAGARSTRAWALELDEFIDSLDDETVLVGVDCHI